MYHVLPRCRVSQLWSLVLPALLDVFSFCCTSTSPTTEVDRLLPRTMKTQTCHTPGRREQDGQENKYKFSVFIVLYHGKSGPGGRLSILNPN